ncbi:MAG TPA: alcohol dehydrogenase catalytic domain-containing protein, partial [Spirochaetia bacterium]|nr:alcohol dehydrogenase catalytic domain-containing protein [Spirochaetia bacterium]
MKAVRLHGKEDLRVDQVDVPHIGAGEMLVRVKAAFICGTDTRMYLHGNPSGVDARTLGHEVSGVIEALGAGVGEPYSIGSRVAIAPNMGCGVCNACVSGNTQMCAALTAIGIHVDGGFAEHLRVPAAAVAQGNVALLADGVSYEQAALAEPFSCVFNAFERLSPRPGGTVLVIGAGPIGLMHAKLHRAAGAGKVIIHDLNEERLAACREEDSSFITIGGRSVKEELNGHTAGAGADI